MQIFSTIVKWLRHYPSTVKFGVQIPIAKENKCLDIGESYNGSTAVSKTACWGSSPYSPAKVSFLIFIKKYVIIFM